MKFLENKYTALEASRRKQNVRNLPSSSMDRDINLNQNKKQFLNKPNKYFNNNESSKSFMRNSTLKSFATKTQNCPLCKDSHGLFHCKTFLNYKPEAKKNTVQKLNLCKNCLYEHKDKTCYSEAKCRVCQGRHNTLLHDAFQADGTTSDIVTNANVHVLPSNNLRNQFTHRNVTHVHGQSAIPETLLATALINVSGQNRSNYVMRALIDQGSQVSLISENAAQMLGLPRRSCKGVISGVGNNQNNCKGMMNITVSSLQSDFTFRTDVFIMQHLIKNLPNQTFTKPTWPFIQNLQLADPDFHLSRPVDILLGADIYSYIIMGGIIKENESQPIAQQTQLGWILCGNVTSFQCNVILNNIQDIQRFWVIEDIAENNDLSLEDNQCIQQYKSTTIRREDGRYVVRLPLKPEISEKLGNSKKRAIAQFYQLEKKFAKNAQIAKEYKAFMNEYIELKHMHECTNIKLPDCILPHLCVLRADSTTTALRVVFNASSKTSSGYSLNDLMHSGPNLQHDLFTLILRWRQYEFAFTADIEKMFRQIICNEKDRQYQKIIWRESPDQSLREYELTTVTYGTKAAPFLSMMTLKQLAEDERSTYPSASKVLEEDFYMDDVLSGHHSLQDAIQLKTNLTKLLKSGGFNLRKWNSNKSELLDQNITTNVEEAFEFRHQESTKTLGLRWLPRDDEFKFQNKINTTSLTPATKRSLLSDISKIFDPLGWLSPVSTKLKLLFQNVWALDLKWDDEVPKNINDEWIKIKSELPGIENIKVERWLQTHKNDNIELHGFCDSSSKAYACVIYCRIRDQEEGKYHSQIIMVAGKSRLVPLNKSISLPRLELSAALLLSKLMKVVLDGLSNYNIKIYGWSDSTAVLGWLQSDPNQRKPFVANRVKKVTEVIPLTHWYYVKSCDNPADCASRGLSVEQLKQHPLWWRGPTWLTTFNEDDFKEHQRKFITLEEMKKSVKTNVITKQNDDIVQNILNKCSQFNRATRILAWTLRAFKRTQHKSSYLTLTEIKKANNIIIKQIQQSEFKEDINSLQKHGQVDSKSNLLKLNPFLDQEGLLRVGGRLTNAEISNNMKHPLIIPRSCHLTDLLIDHAHQITYHGGPRLTLAWLRHNYWIVGGNRTVKKRLRNCVTCRRHNPIKQHQIMGDLPAARSNPTRPFYHTGVDYTGFVDIKTNKGRGVKTTKGYIAVFVCMATKAVHLELVSDLSSSAFLAALRRMAARRGAPCHIYSDNGTNFVGANKALNETFINLKQTLDTEFFDAITDMFITWHFNAPSWPTAGGLWEAAVKSLKYHLKRVVGEQKLTFEEYSTLLAQLEACLNNRPLCALSEDPEDLDCLTPSHFLATGPTLTIVETERDLRTRWQLTQKIFSDIWKRWRSEYLCQISSRSKWCKPQPNIQVNDIVIIHDNNLPSGKWAMGRVLELHPGNDGYVRVVTVKTKSGLVKRPITKLSTLPVHETETKNQTEENTNTSNTSNKHPKRKTSTLCNVIYSILMLFMIAIPQTSCEYQMTTFNNNQSIYFDKIANMRLEREEWKLIIYCDMAPYWRGTTLLQKYIDHLRDICETKKVSQCDILTLQLGHGYHELDHYNKVLLGQQNGQTVRRRRGLINGVGYVAHTLFGILDDNFAQQYQNDINILRNNQNHLSILWKNQTSIVEAELNIIKRIGDSMDKQHKMMNQYIKNLNNGVNLLNEEIQRTDLKNDYTLSALIANNILLNLKNIQETLLNTLTNINYEKFNLHLITPDQLKNEFNIINSQIAKDLSLPINNVQTDLAKIFHLLKVKARATTQYIIIEVKIPLVSRDNYELYNIIPIPKQVGETMVTVARIADHLAINIQKDAYIPITTNDLQKCIPSDSNEYICPLKTPIHQMTSDKSLCFITKSNECQIEKTICKDNWHELNMHNSYLYFCCGQCTVRVICEDSITFERLSKSGIITLSENCVIKGRTFTIYSQKTLSNTMKIKTEVINFEMPKINNIINLSIPLLDSFNNSTDIEDRKKMLNKIGSAISDLKENETSILADRVSYHDIHHYVAIYIMFGVAGIIGTAYVWRRLRRPCFQVGSASQPTAQPAEPSVHYSTVVKEDPIPRVRVNRGSSPVIRKQFSL